jgi:hypothetical protein
MRVVVRKKENDSMTANEFRKAALALPDAVEQSHMNHPDFRVGGKIFATLGRDEAWGMVKLTPEQQAEFMHDYPKMFEAFNGAWGAGGATRIILKAASKTVARLALLSAWRNTAPKQNSLS